MTHFLSSPLTRRELLALGLGAAASTLLTTTAQAAPKEPNATTSHLPRWRGFNLLEKFTLDGNAPYQESDFDMIAGWGFNFVRLPTDYRIWTKAPGQYDEAMLKEIDSAVAYGRARGIHVNLCLHRAPGYCVNPPKEALDLWADGADGDEARKQFAAQWAMFATRYKNIPASEVSFDLVNEPGDMAAAPYVRAVSAAVTAIHGVDPHRLVIADGLKWGNVPVPELAKVKVAQSMHDYTPIQLTHYKASWMEGSDTWPVPDWPLTVGGQNWDKTRLQKDQVAPWQALVKQGVGVHIGEWGAYNQTPHPIVLAWMRDQLSLWHDAGFGWALWNFRGSFGVLDSDRGDVVYETYQGHKLDRAMLNLLQQG